MSKSRKPRPRLRKGERLYFRLGPNESSTELGKRVRDGVMGLIEEHRTEHPTERERLSPGDAEAWLRGRNRLERLHQHEQHPDGTRVESER